MLKYWLYTPRPLRIPTERNTSLLGRAIAEIGFLNDLSALQVRVRKSLLEKTGKGEATVQDFLGKREEVEQIIRTPGLHRNRPAPVATGGSSSDRTRPMFR